MKYIYYVTYTWGGGTPLRGGMADWGTAASEITVSAPISRIEQLRNMEEAIYKINPQMKEVVITNWIHLRDEE